MNNPQPTPPRWSTLLPRLAHYLPAGQFNPLRSLPEDLDKLGSSPTRDVTNALLNANRTLEPLYRVLVQYMPRYLTELDPTPGHPRSELVEGSFIFADVTGFTALTELLSKQGHARGRELMNQIMNRLFTEILDPLIASGGDLLIFAGDAALVFFPKQENDEDVLQAIRAALRMERAIIPFESFETEYGQCSLTMSAGVERGIAYAGVVGTEARMELLMSGPGIDGAMQAEVQADPGRVALGEQALAVAVDHFSFNGSMVIDDLGNALGDYEISLPTRKRGGSVIMGIEIPEILSSIESELERVEKLAPFLPEDMLAHLVNTDRHRKLVSEFRPVAVQFIHIVGLEKLAVSHGPELATQVFQRYFVRAQEIVNQHEGIISQIDAYAEGFFLLNTFGTPKAHEGTTRYAVSAALQLEKALGQINKEFQLETPLQQRGGITYGLVFNGEIGAKYRRESVVAGPAVNRAARLMSKAQFGQVILDTEIWADVQMAFVGEKLPSVKLKGIEGEVVIVDVREIRRGTRLQPLERPPVGRDREQARLEQAIENLLQRQRGSAWSIYGETGIGKTTLMLSLADVARQKNLTILAGRCQPHGKHIPLFVWIDLLTGWLDVDESTDPVKQRARLTQELTALGISDAEKSLLHLLALSKTETLSANASNSTKRQPANKKTAPPALGGLSALLENRLAQQSQPKIAKTMWKRLEERISGPRVIIQLLEQLAKRQPLLIILEDIHWLDRESAALLKKVVEQMSHLPIVFLLTGRQPVEDVDLSHLELSGLSNEAMAQVAQRAFGGRTLDNSLAEWIFTQAGGNPLFAQELCHALQQANAVLLDRETGEVRWTKQAPILPLSLHELLLARLDELPLPQQDILKRAAVIGVSFEKTGLVRLCKKRLSEREAEAALERVVQAGFLSEVQFDLYRFNHPLMQEAIYATLSFSQRQIWHTDIGNWLIKQQSEQNLELIAYHHLRGNDTNKAAQYALQAANKARQNGAYDGAADYYQQVLALDDAPQSQRMIAAENGGDMLAVQQQYDSARELYRQAEELGNVSAAEKLAIISGSLERIAQTEFSPTFRAWAEGSRAWLLAQNGKADSALDAAQAALNFADDSVQEAIEKLLNTLKSGEAVDSYESWLQQFGQAVLLLPSTEQAGVVER